MTDTWNVFTGTDVFLGLLGAVGFLSVIVVIVTATGRVNRREKTLRVARTLQNLEPEENLLETEEEVVEEDPYHYNGGNYYETSGK